MPDICPITGRPCLREKCAWCFKVEGEHFETEDYECAVTIIAAALTNLAENIGDLVELLGEGKETTKHLKPRN